VSETSEAIQRGVEAWLEANRLAVLDNIKKAAEASADRATELVATGVMVKVGQFFDNNKDALTTSIAAAIALSWQARQHPVPKQEEK
jgi:hypothetical protein